MTEEKKTEPAKKFPEKTFTELVNEAGGDVPPTHSEKRRQGLLDAISDFHEKHRRSK